MKYNDMQAQAKLFLAHCVAFSIAEHEQNHEEPVTSANEALGLATRLLAEQAGVLQTEADQMELDEKIARSVDRSKKKK